MSRIRVRLRQFFISFIMSLLSVSLSTGSQTVINERPAEQASYPSAVFHNLWFSGNGFSPGSTRIPVYPGESIQQKIDSITDSGPNKPYVILIYPGVYEELVDVDKDYVALVGVEREKCIIQKGDIARYSVVKIYKSSGDLSNVGVVNLTIKNLNYWGQNGTAAQEAIQIGKEGGGGNQVRDVIIRNCYLYGYQDTTFVYPNAQATFEDCIIEGGFDIASCWQAEATYKNCDFIMNHTAGCVAGYLARGIQRVFNCTFISRNAPGGAWDIESANSTLYFFNNYLGDGMTTTGVRFLATQNCYAYVGGNYCKNDVVWSEHCTFMNTHGINIKGDTSIQGNLNLANNLTMYGNLTEVNNITMNGNLRNEWTSEEGESAPQIIWSWGLFEDTISDNMINLSTRLLEGGLDSKIFNGAFVNIEQIEEDELCEGRGDVIKYIYKPYNNSRQTRFKIGYDGAVSLYNQRGERRVHLDSESGDVSVSGAVKCGEKEVIDKDGFFRPRSAADSEAPENSIYFSTTQNVLVYKDAGGKIHPLYFSARVGEWRDLSP